LRVQNREQFVQALANQPPDIILSDHGLPAFDGLTALAIAKEKVPETPFIFVTGSSGRGDGHQNPEKRRDGFTC
jgi:CheY-like chemotaxis protein